MKKKKKKKKNNNKNYSVDIQAQGVRLKPFSARFPCQPAAAPTQATKAGAATPAANAGSDER